MKAVAFSEFGKPNVVSVRDIDMPKAGDEQVVVRVAASTVNPTDILKRTGAQAAMMTALKPPYVAGVEFAGTVHSVGSKVKDFAVGDRVMGVVNSRRPEKGAHAEYVVAHMSVIAKIRPDADFVEAATVPMNGLTALMCIEALALPKGASVLVTGGPGAAGTYAIEFAKQAGLKVVADAKESDVAWLRKAGADDIVPRGDGMAAAVRKLYPNGVDGLVDCALLGAAAAAAVKDGGATVSVRSTHMIDNPRLKSHRVNVFTNQDNEPRFKQVGEAYWKGILTPRVAKVLPMTEAVEANRLVEAGGLRGRVVLTFGG